MGNEADRTEAHNAARKECMGSGKGAWLVVFSNSNPVGYHNYTFHQQRDRIGEKQNGRSRPMSAKHTIPALFGAAVDEAIHHRLFSRGGEGGVRFAKGGIQVSRISTSCLPRLSST